VPLSGTPNRYRLLLLCPDERLNALPFRFRNMLVRDTFFIYIYIYTLTSLATLFVILVLEDPALAPASSHFGLCFPSLPDCQHHQRLVDNYLNQFKDLIEDSGYSDLKTIVVKFCRGLDRRISTALAGMTYGRPSDTDPEAWFCLAVRMDQNRTADEAFHTSHWQPHLPAPGISHILMAS